MLKKAPVIGILVLDCPNLEIPGYVGSDDTFPFTVKRRVVKGATVEKMTSGSEELLGPILDAAGELEREGVDAIIGGCGFMTLFQKALQESVSVPVFTSSLLLVPMVSRMIPHGKRIGILSFRATTLKEAHFRGAGWSSNEIPVAIAGVQDQSAWQLFLTREHPSHVEDLEKELLDVCRQFVHDHSDLASLILECTIMPPFAHKIQAEVELPVFDITMIASLVAESFSRKPFEKKHSPLEEITGSQIVSLE